MGPTVAILLPYEPDASDHASLDDIVRSVSSQNSCASDFHVEKTVAIGGTVEAGEGGRPFAAAFEEPLLEESQVGVVRSEFGFAPAAVLVVSAMCNENIDHRILGEFAAHFAKHFGGVIDFCGDLGIRPRTGKLVDAPYIVDGRQCTSHVGDLIFMRDWLRDPLFHMIK